MWVNRQEWQRMQERLMDLERKVQASGQITVYKKVDFSCYPMPLPRAYIPIESVVRDLCERIGCELVYHDGQPEKAVLQKKEKAK